MRITAAWSVSELRTVMAGRAITSRASSSVPPSVAGGALKRSRTLIMLMILWPDHEQDVGVEFAEHAVHVGDRHRLWHLEGRRVGRRADADRLEPVGRPFLADVDADRRNPSE